ncbi:hypothetical protein EUX58_12655, partial [Pseudomonas sp. 770NI]|uniref:colicin E5-related ribonuclease n=1 Tax=Pseudomonas sp. 770NI TaxID=2528664 RepID=UPI0010D63BC8
AADRLAAQQAAAAKAAADQLAAQQAAAAKAAADKAAADRLAAQQAAAAKAAADKAAADRLAAQQAAAAKAAADQLAAQQAAAAYRLAAQQADKAFADKLAAQQATAAKAAAIKAAADKVAADKLAVERAAASKAYFEKIAAHKLALQAAADRKAAEAKAAADKLAALKAIADKIEATRAKNTFKISSVTKTTQVSAVAGSIALTANTTLTLDTAVKSAIQMLNSLKSAATLETTAGLLARYIPFSLLVWSPKLGNSDLYPSNQPQVLFTAPVSEIFPELNHSDLLTKGYNWKTATVPYRIHGNPTGFSLIETGKNLKVDPHVKVFVIVTNKKLNAHKIMTGDIPPQTMFFPMETPANSSTETPAQLVNPIVYDGVTLTPIEVKAETLPAVDQLTFRDCIYCFPADTGLPPIYVVFSEPADNLIIDSKIKVQIPERGWTEQDIISITSKEHAGESRDNRRASKTPDGNPRNDRALVYGSPGKYVIVNSRTREVIQISDVSGKPWIDDSRIKWSK